MTSQDTPQQPGEALPIADNPSKSPAVVPDGVLDPSPSSFPAGPSGPVPGDQSRILPALSSVLTDPSTLDGVEQVPPPPAEPYEDFLHRTGCLSTASTSSGLQPVTADVTMDLVTLPSALPRPFPTFVGLDQHPRAPAPMPGPGKFLPDRFYIPPPDPLAWPGRGPAVPAFPAPFVAPGLPPSHAGAPRTFSVAVANHPGPLTVLMTPGPSAKITISYPCAWPDFSTDATPLSLGPAGPTAGPTPLPLQPDLLAGPPVPPTHRSQQLKLLPLFLHHPRPLSRLPRSPQRRLRRYRTFKPG